MRPLIWEDHVLQSSKACALEPAHPNPGAKRGREQTSPVLHLDPVSHVNKN